MQQPDLHVRHVRGRVDVAQAAARERHDDDEDDTRADRRGTGAADADQDREENRAYRPLEGLSRALRPVSYAVGETVMR